MYCRVKPYEGNEPYAFFSYCHKDAQQVYPMIEQLASAGYRVWYDDGIHPGADWTEVIAKHISNSALCIAVVSEASVCSHNCRNEINYIIELGLNLLPIILSDFPMSLGVRLQLSTSQYIRRYAYSDDRAFYETLFSAEGLGACRGRESYIDESHGLKQERLARIAAEENARSQLEKVKELLRSPVETGGDAPAPPRQDEASRADSPEAGGSGTNTQTPMSWEYDVEDEPTVLEEQTVLIGDAGAHSRKRELPTAVLIRLQDGTVYSIRGKTTKIGRDDVQDIVIPKKTIGRLHAEILYNTQGFFLRDDDSLNGTALNGKQIDGMQPVPLGQGAVISFAEELFVFMAGSEAEAALKKGACAYLCCLETEETRCLTSQDFLLGRSNPWSGGTFQDRHASRIHGRISGGEDGQRVLIISEKETPNGTFLNGRLLNPGSAESLRSGDMIGIGHIYHIVYHEIVLKGNP